MPTPEPDAKPEWSWSVLGTLHAKLRAHPHQYGPGKTHGLYRTFEKPRAWLVLCTDKPEETIHGERVTRETEVDCKKCLKRGGGDW